MGGAGWEGLLDVVIPMGRVEEGSVMLGFGVRSWGSVPGLVSPCSVVAMSSTERG